MLLLMGSFANLVVSVVYPQNGQFESQTNVIEFEDKTFISWELGKHPSGDWNTAGINSIHFKKGGKILSQTEYEKKCLVKEVTIGIIRKKVIFELIESYKLPGKNIYHLALPELCVPKDATFCNRKPEYSIKVDNRVALTWIFEGDISVDFMFKELSENDFKQYKTKGDPIRMIVDPSSKVFFGRLCAKLNEEGKDFGARVFAHYLNLQQRGT